MSVPFNLLVSFSCSLKFLVPGCWTKQLRLYEGLEGGWRAWRGWSLGWGLRRTPNLHPKPQIPDPQPPRPETLNPKESRMPKRPEAAEPQCPQKAQEIFKWPWTRNMQNSKRKTLAKGRAAPLHAADDLAPKLQGAVVAVGRRLIAGFRVGLRFVKLSLRNPERLIWANAPLRPAAPTRQCKALCVFFQSCTLKARPNHSSSAYEKALPFQGVQLNIS